MKTGIEAVSADVAHVDADPRVLLENVLFQHFEHGEGTVTNEALEYFLTLFVPIFVGMVMFQEAFTTDWTHMQIITILLVSLHVKLDVTDQLEAFQAD